jgi:hypothetical protein
MRPAIKSEIGELVYFYSKQKIPYERMLNKGVFGKKLFNLIYEDNQDKKELGTPAASDQNKAI